LATAGAVPLLSTVAQVLLKTLRDIAGATRETLYPIILYEEGDEGYLNRIGKFRGLEFLMQAGGTALAGWMVYGLHLDDLGYRISLYVAGAVVVVAAGWWFFAFREHPRKRSQRIISLRELASFDLHPNLIVITIGSAIFTFGVVMSHSFILPLFYSDQARFPLMAGWVPLIMVIHRFTIAAPMLVVGNLPIRNYKVWYIGGYIIQGITVAASALLPQFWASAAIFLLHDLVGAGFWSPIQATLIQRYSRDETRGLEVGKVATWSSVGAIVGPLAAGYLASRSIILPMFVSGLLMIVAAIPLFWLNLHLPSPGAETQASRQPARA
jgi:MFS family permease